MSNHLTAAVVLAPFFVHLEILFGLGYRPAMHKRINNMIGMEITRIRQAEGDKKRKAKSS
jgi:2-hydroxy fatty acid dioxygenase